MSTGPKQIRDYLLKGDSGVASGGWETWLRANRPKALLGSRWLISTKGVFVGLQMAMIVLALNLSPSPDGFFAAIATIFLLLSAGFLLTNAKE